MGLTAYTRLLRFVTFVHLPFSFRSLDLLVASLLFMKGASSCVKKKLEPSDRAMAKFLGGHRSAWFPLFISACRFVYFDTSNLSCVSALFWLISIARCVFKSPGIWFWGTEYDIYCARVACLHISILWGRARLWLELFASTVRAGRFLSRVSYLLWHVFLRRRSFTLKKL